MVFRGHCVQGPQCSLCLGATVFAVFRGHSVQGPQSLCLTHSVFSVLLCHQGKAGDDGKPGTPGKMVTHLSVSQPVRLSLPVCLYLFVNLSVCLTVNVDEVIGWY